MSWLLHELALESVLIVLFVVRWAIEWWAGGRVAKRNAKLIADNNEARDHIKTELAEIKNGNSRLEEMALELDQRARDIEHRVNLTEVRTTQMASATKGEDAE